MDLSVRLSLYYLLYRWWTERDQTRQEGQRCANLEIWYIGISDVRIRIRIRIRIRMWIQIQACWIRIRIRIRDARIRTSLIGISYPLVQDPIR